MIQIDNDRPVRFCDGFNRRDLLRAGALGFFGLTLPDLLRVESARAGSRRDKSCILLFLVGGPSQHDTWDPKPLAPAGIRGPYRPIPVRGCDAQIAEPFPRTARHGAKIAFIRSLYHTEAPIHETGHQLMQTGRYSQGEVQYPHLGAVASRINRANGAVPPFALLPGPIGNTGVAVPHGQGAGYLGARFDPFVLDRDPNADDYRAADLLAPPAVEPVRLGRRRALRDCLDLAVQRFEASEDARLGDDAFQRAWGMLSSSGLREAFDIAREPDRLREAYGRSRFGQSCLLARRLVERGARLVTVNMFDTVFGEVTWDVHGSAPFPPVTAIGDTVGPLFDQAYAALLQDLDDRGLLDSTLVVATGEMGRTPLINPAEGRDHWPHVWSALLAGGGIRGGQVIGASDEIGAYPKERPVGPQEMLATVYHALGVRLDTEFPGPGGEPVRVVDEGVEPIWEVF